jgi:hypothetical protein
MMRSFSVIRFLAAVVVAVGLSVAAGAPSAAQDDEENGRTAAQEVRELVLKQRERVLAHVAAIMAGNREDDESAEMAKIEEAEDGEGEDGEAEDGEGEDGEGEDEGEDGEGEDEGEDEGVGGEGEECEPQGGAVASGEAEGDAAAGGEAEGAVAAGDEAESAEAEDGGATGGEAEDAQPMGGVADTAGDQEICSLPSTGTGSNSDMPGMLSVFAALAAVTAGFGLRQRFI